MSFSVEPIAVPSAAKTIAMSAMNTSAIGTAAQFYPSGQMTNVRQVTVWLDAESLLVRKVFEDTPKGYPTNAYLRLTIILDPLANPQLEDANFQFTVPGE